MDNQRYFSAIIHILCVKSFSITFSTKYNILFIKYTVFKIKIRALGYQ